MKIVVLVCALIAALIGNTDAVRVMEVIKNVPVPLAAVALIRKRHEIESAYMSRFSGAQTAVAAAKQPLIPSTLFPRAP